LFYFLNFSSICDEFESGMIVYKKAGIDFLPRYLWWMVSNLYLLFILLFLLLCLFTLLILYSAVSGLAFLFWIIIGICVYLYVNRNARPCRVELRDKSLVITCSKYFSVFDIAVNYEDLRIELYKNKYYQGNYEGSESQHYLYFTSATDKKVWMELSATFYTLGKILDALSKEPNIILEDRELNFVDNYHKQLEADKTPRTRLAKAMIPVILIALAILIWYQCSGK
jgi:hypothetical protein